MAAISDLTDQQRSRITPWVDAVIADYATTEPADQARVESGIRRCYEYAGLAWHNRVVWVDSPMQVIGIGPTASALIDAGIPTATALDRAVSGERDFDAIRELWRFHSGGRASLVAYLGFYRDVVGVEAQGDAWDRFDAFVDAQAAGWWWPHTDFVVVAHKHTEADGTKVSWRNGDTVDVQAPPRLVIPV